LASTKLGGGGILLFNSPSFVLHSGPDDYE